MDILSLIPIIVFGSLLVAVFILFISGSVVFLFSGEQERGKDSVIKSLIGLFIVLLMFLAFWGITYLVKNMGIFNSQQVTGEFPAPPSSDFPPPFIQ